MDFTPKPVIHNGNVFRSSTEYRWALFLENLKIHYLYEVRCFDTEHGRYLPDFYLPNLKIWIEIKGQEPTDIEVKKCLAVREQTGEPVLIVSGRPNVDHFHEGLLPSGFMISCVFPMEKSHGLSFSSTELYTLVKEVCGEPFEKILLRFLFSLMSAKDFDREGYWLGELVERYLRLIAGPFNYSRQKLTNIKKAKNQEVSANEIEMLKVIDYFTHARVPVHGLKRSVIRKLQFS